jgi:putative endonuclease
VVRTARQRSGDAAEDLVADHLTAVGWTIVGRQVHVGRAELDLIAVDPRPPPTLVVVEVRWRGSRSFGVAEETIDYRKRAHLRAAIGRLLDERAARDVVLPRLPVRADLIVVEPPLRRGDRARLRHHRAIEL